MTEPLDLDAIRDRVARSGIGGSGASQREVLALISEVERLRAALKEIADDDVPCNDPNCGYDACSHAARHARRALQGSEEG